MKARLRAMKISILVWTLIIFVLIGPMCIPVLPSVVEVRFPSSEGWVTSLDNQTVTVTRSLSIRNSG